MNAQQSATTTGRVVVCEQQNYLNTLAAAALDYVRRGWLSFPAHSIRNGGCTCGNPQCDRPGKHPATAHGLKDATTDPEQIRAWWQERPWLNVAIVTGRESGLVVIDVDEGPNKHGAATLAALEAEHGPLPVTVTARTGSGGRHLLFQRPDTLNKIKTGTNVCGPNLDVRADGGYIIAPPSNHYSGGLYAWITSPDTTPLAVLPDWLRRMIEVQPRPRSTDRPRPVATGGGDDLRAALFTLSPDCDYSQWVQIGMALHATGRADALLLWENWSAGSAKYPGPDALRRHWESFQPGGGVTEATLYGLARAAGWRSPKLPADCGRRGQAAPPGPASTDPTDPAGNLLPWHDATPPAGWKLDGKGVCVDTRTKAEKEAGDPPAWKKVAGQIWIAGRTRSRTGSGWGLVVHWIDHDGNLHERAIPAGRFHEQGPALAQELSGDGLMIVPGMERRLIQYLGSFEDDRRILSVDRLGWLDNKAAELAYVLPGEVITKAGNERILFQPERYAPTAATMHANGTLAEWQQHVAHACGDHPMLLFAICAALSAPLMKPGGLDGGGFHFYGPTTGGKTTLLQAGASVWGCGADPAYAGDLAFTRRWNVTTNGIEGLAAAHNDGPLCLDEIGTCNAKDFGGLIYNLAGGQGKVAMDSTRALKPTQAWLVQILSTGEVSNRAKIEQDGRTAKGGQLLRLIDIPVPAGGTLATIPDPARFADELKRNCGLYYGTAGSALVRALVNHAEDAQALRNWAAAQLGKAVELLTVPHLAPEQARALKRFALALVAGLAAAEHGILPLPKAAIVGAARYVRDLWLTETQGTATDAERAIESVRAFILRHADSRFTVIGGRGDSEAGDGRPVVNRAGFRDLQRGLWLLTPDGFKEACEGHDPKAVARELQGRGWLHLNEADRLTSKHRIPGFTKTVGLYAVKDAAIIGSDADAPDPT